MRRFAGCARYVYNRALALGNGRFDRGEKRLGYSALCGLLTQWKQEESTQWLGEAPSQVLQQALNNLDRAYANLFQGLAEAPVFKKKGRGSSFRFPPGLAARRDEQPPLPAQARLGALSQQS